MIYLTLYIRDKQLEVNRGPIFIEYHTKPYHVNRLGDVYLDDLVLK